MPPDREQLTSVGCANGFAALLIADRRQVQKTTAKNNTRDHKKHVKGKKLIDIYSRCGNIAEIFNFSWMVSPES